VSTGVTGDTDAATTLDEFVLVDGTIVLREGDTVSKAAPVDFTVSGSIEGGSLNEDGDWAVIWDVDTDTGNVESLILNGGVVLLEGDLVDWNGDGAIDAADDGARIENFTGISTLVLSDRDTTGALRLYFTADVVLDSTPDLVEGFMCLTVSALGCPPDLTGDGMIGFDDLHIVLSTWGPCPGCLGDIDGDGMVGFSDLLIILSTWGPCP